MSFGYLLLILVSDLAKSFDCFDWKARGRHRYQDCSHFYLRQQRYLILPSESKPSNTKCRAFQFPSLFDSAVQELNDQIRVHEELLLENVSRQHVVSDGHYPGFD